MLKTKLLLGMLVVANFAHAADLYVSPAGSDSNGGSQAAPVASLARAQALVRSHAGKTPVTVHVGDGIYYLPETLVFTPADSGTAAYPVVFMAENEGGAVLSGGSKLNLSWQPYRDGIYQATTPTGLEIDQLFINGRNQRMARYPNYDPNKKAEPYQGYSADAFSKDRAANWADPTGGYIHGMHRASWGGYHFLITGKDATGKVTYEGGWQNNRKSGMHEKFRMVENIFEELDAEGEWYHNAKTDTLYYKPAAGTDLHSATVEVVRLRHLVEFQGSESAPVKHITLQGFVVRHAARTFMDTKEQLLRSDWAIYRGGAFMLTGTEDIQILDTEFDQVGGNAIFVNNYNRRTLVKGCHIHDSGASGVCFVGDPDAVRNPLFEYNEKNDLASISRTPGPKTNNYPSLGVVEDCLIHGIGRTERQPAGVMMDMAMEITIRDTSIYDTARAGLNIGDGAWGGHLIERVDVFDTVLETHDHGSFNSWGRDRYWRSDHLTASQAAVDKEPDLPFLDAIKTTVIRDSRWRCEHGWDIDLDDGSSNYDIYNNLMLCGGLKLREGFRRRVWNNVIINNGLSSHVWFQNSNDSVHSNIMARANGPYIKEDVTVEGLVNRNFYYSSNEVTLKQLQAKYNWDADSKVGDPLFVDPENGDFSVKEGSPAFAVGFKNFPMDQFGVKKPSLKAIARTPSFGPKPSKAKPTPDKAAVVPQAQVWQGATLHSLQGEEFSAYGVTKSDGGVALKRIVPGSVMAQAGFKTGDLIQRIDGQKVSTTTDLFKILASKPAESYEMTVVRNQQSGKLRIVPHSDVVVETSNEAGGFSKLPLAAKASGTITTKPKTSNEPVAVLTDGRLADDFGCVFGNTIRNGVYRMDLGAVKDLSAVTAWSFNQSGSRGAQMLTIYGSNDSKDPGWDLGKFTALGSIDTTALTRKDYSAVSLRARSGKSLGSYRWIAWAVSPVSEIGGGENTAFQEFSVEVR
ncbi:site-2 protease family protein [Coraliomargarita algicola]|uniref:Site-2 protease family protein n=1 Tax=Coraliomargarita algicola TaxID=3092156 RepID=A0ABZ0RP32_9BACT|nr:PDZ domain-containing protein [Coraliomargarita sp. J2-16]WPJ97287.1 site-2 protease family protein [Coraliomargarita sp. J2-16]